MTNANRKRLRFLAAAVTAGALAGTVAPVAASAAQAAPAAWPAPGAHHKTTVRVDLAAMPAGTVMVGWSAGQPAISLSAFGLTPGSAHTVLLNGHPIGTLTASAAGMAAATVPARGIPAGSRVKLLDGGPGTNVIAQTSRLHHSGGYRLHAVEAGFPQGSLRGHATITDDPAANKITVTVDASGVSPGMHAAHIHSGSCQSQGPVLYMLMDFTADAHGRINHETRTVTASVPLPASGWYLNLHQGNGNNILANGNPTILFRPLLCANI